MRRIGNLRDGICLAVCLAIGISCATVLAEEDEPAELPQPATAINPLRLGSVPRAKAAGRWVEWRAGAKWEGEYEDGKRHGTWEGVVPVTEESHFAEADYQGFESPFTIRVTLDRNVAHGEISGIDAQQRPIFTWHVDQGVLEGSATWWHPSGQSRRQVTYRAGLLDGPLTQWNVDGKVVLQETYREGRGSRPHIGWHQPGRKRSEGYSHLPGEVSRDTFDWQELRWSQTTVHEYFSEERCGRWTAWYANGQKRLLGGYQDGEAEGRFTWWHQNGQKMAEGEYNSGKQHGLWRFWHSHGQRHLVGEYEYGQISAGWDAWTADARPAAFDPAQAVLALDWDEPQAEPQSIVKRPAPAVRPTRSGAVDEAAPVQASARTTKPAAASPSAVPKASQTKSVLTSPAASKSKDAKAAQSQQSNTGVFPGLLPGPTSNQAAQPPAFQSSSDEFTLLGLLFSEKSRSPKKSPTPTPARKAPARNPRPEPGNPQPDADDASPPESSGIFLSEILGMEPAAPPRRAASGSVRR